MKKVCCFGHREIFRDIESADDIYNLKNNVSRSIECLIDDYGYNIFMTGGRGEFDNLFAEEVRKLKVKYPHIKLVLVEPYFSDKLNKYKAYYETMYDSIIVPDELANVHYKKAIESRNKWLVDNSDMVISYVNRWSGGAYKAIKYAMSLKRFVMNLGNIDTLGLNKK